MALEGMYRNVTCDTYQFCTISMLEHCWLTRVKIAIILSTVQLYIDTCHIHPVTQKIANSLLS